jgi:hypothetical protein
MTTAAELATTWYGDLHRGDMPDVWRCMTDDFRLAVTQSVLHRARERGEDVDRLVDDLSSPDPKGTDRDEFWDAARVQLLRVAGDVDPADLGVGSRPRLLSADLEMVALFHLADLEDPSVFAPNETATVTPVLIAWDGEEPRVAGLGYLLEPGWPPQVAWAPSPSD